MVKVRGLQHLISFNGEVICAFSTIEVDEVGLAIAECLLTDTVQSILTPAAFVLATIAEQLDTVPMPLTVLMLAEILVELGVMAEAESAHHAVLEHSLVDEAIVVQQSADSMHLVLIIDLTVVEAVL